MTKTSAILQLVIILGIVGYSTYHLFQGNLEKSLSLLPLLILYYVFVTARKKWGRSQNNDEKQGS